MEQSDGPQPVGSWNECHRKHAAGSARIIRVRITWRYSQDSDVQVGQTVVEWAPVGATIDASKDPSAGGSGVEDIGVLRVDHEGSDAGADVEQASQTIIYREPACPTIGALEHPSKTLRGVGAFRPRIEGAWIGQINRKHSDGGPFQAGAAPTRAAIRALEHATGYMYRGIGRDFDIGAASSRVEGSGFSRIDHQCPNTVR